jgi:hypothetical protein
VNKSELFVRLADGKPIRIERSLVTQEWTTFILTLQQKGHLSIRQLGPESAAIQLTEKGLAAWKRSVVKLLVNVPRPWPSKPIKLVDKPQLPKPRSRAKLSS